MPAETDVVEPVGDIQKMLRDAIAIAMAGRRLVMGTAVLTTVLALLVLRMIEPSFTATLIVGPTAAEGLLPGSMINGTAYGMGEKMSYYDRFLYAIPPQELT